MTNPTIDLIARHGSVRRYRPEPVAREMIETIVAAGQRASTSSNLQAYSVIAVTDPERKARISELSGDQTQIYQAPALLVWCLDRARLARACALRGYEQNTHYMESFLVAAVDVALAAQNGALAAESLGLGICYIGSIRNHTQAIIDILELPPFTFPITGMTIGRPAETPMIRPRLPLEAVLHWERYNPDQDEALAAYDRAMAATGIYGGRQVAVPGKEGEMEEYGWTEHTARRISQPKRTEMRSVIERQGFRLA
ncbi:MAG: NADPH-dependent oxidoreductase [Caldilineaceae bacterium]|nr:NADPH-dependent oxidoreductase [Caldilineaceae bacterium]